MRAVSNPEVEAMEKNPEGGGVISSVPPGEKMFFFILLPVKGHRDTINSTPVAPVVYFIVVTLECCYE